MPLYDFRCPSGHVFQDLSIYDETLKKVVAVPCDLCQDDGERVWLRPPAMHGDENMNVEERVRAQLKGHHVETRQQLRAFAKEMQDEPVTLREDFDSGEKEVRSGVSINKGEMVEKIKELQSKKRAGNLPSVEQLAEEHEVKALDSLAAPAIESQRPEGVGVTYAEN